MLDLGVVTTGRGNWQKASSHRREKTKPIGGAGDDSDRITPKPN